jgi:hypothetical protein
MCEKKLVKKMKRERLEADDLTEIENCGLRQLKDLIRS